MSGIFRNIILALLLLPSSAVCADTRATQRVRDAINYWRDNTSYSEAAMTVHRPDWERKMEMRSWTEGEDYSLVRFVAPPQDAGSASLKINDEMWSFSPKVNRVIKIPASMMTQSWMGSDFSYNDLAKADDLVKNYTHRILGEDTHEGKKAEIIEALPLEEAPVPWGKEIISVRSDNIILYHEFYDQDMKLVKKLTARNIKMLGGKLFPEVIHMQKVSAEDEWTEIVHRQVQFDVKLPPGLFTQTSLRNPRG